jgi:hypothetical protein
MSLHHTILEADESQLRKYLSKEMLTLTELRLLNQNPIIYRYPDLLERLLDLSRREELTHPAPEGSYRHQTSRNRYERIALNAVKGDHLSIVKKAIELGATDYPELLEHAHPGPVMEYLREELQTGEVEPPSINVLDDAYYQRYDKVLEALPSLDDETRRALAEIVAAHKDLPVLKKIVEAGVDEYASIVETAGEVGHKEMVDYLLSIDSSEESLLAAARGAVAGGHLDLLKELPEIRDEELPCMASRKGYSDILSYLIGRGYNDLNEYLEQAGDNEDIGLMLIEMGAEDPC